MAERDQLGREAWTQAALDALGEEGLHGVAVEPLARALKVTKGSFYWHFKTRDELLLAAMERWANTQTEALIQAATNIRDPRQRLLGLIDQAHRSRAGLKLTHAVAAAAAHPVVGPVARRVSERRLSFLTECFTALALTPAAANNAARVVYCSYLGLAELEALGLGPKTHADLRAHVDYLLAALVPKRASRSSASPKR
jgi:AcrR family transcriptional regulator